MQFFRLHVLTPLVIMTTRLLASPLITDLTPDNPPHQ